MLSTPFATPCICQPRSNASCNRRPHAARAVPSSAPGSARLLRSTAAAGPRSRTPQRRVSRPMFPAPEFDFRDAGPPHPTPPQPAHRAAGRASLLPPSQPQPSDGPPPAARIAIVALPHPRITQGPEANDLAKARRQDAGQLGQKNRPPQNAAPLPTGAFRQGNEKAYQLGWRRHVRPALALAAPAAMATV